MIDAVLCNPGMRDGHTPCFKVTDSQADGFRLKRVRYWKGDGKAGKILPWIALNPSGANPSGRGLSGLTMARLANLWGFDGVATYNILPFQGSKPKLDVWPRLRNGEQNHEIQKFHQKTAADLKDADALVVGWGSQGGPFGECIERLARHLVDSIDAGRGSVHVKLWCIGTNRDGTPKHAGALGKSKIPDCARPSEFKFRLLAGG